MQNARREAHCRWSSWSVARSTPSWPSAATSGITRRGSCSSRKPAAGSPTAPVDTRAIRVAAFTPTPTCTLSYSLRWITRRDPDLGCLIRAGFEAQDGRVDDPLGLLPYETLRSRPLAVVLAPARGVGFAWEGGSLAVPTADPIAIV